MFIINSIKLETLLWQLPSLTTFTTSGALPPAIFRCMQHGLLQELEVLHGDVFPDGLNAFLDLVEFYSRSQYQPRIAYIYCHDGSGLNEVRERYVSSHKKYEHVFTEQWRVQFKDN